MLTDMIPIELFIQQKFQNPRVKKLVEPMDVDPEQLMTTLTRYFIEMGFFLVQPGQEHVIFESMLTQLKESPDIKAIVTKAARERQRLASTRRGG